MHNFREQFSKQTLGPPPYALIIILPNLTATASVLSGQLVQYSMGIERVNMLQDIIMVVRCTLLTASGSRVPGAS